MRLIQASILIALVIYNASRDGKNKLGTKELAISIAKSYMRKGQVRLCMLSVECLNREQRPQKHPSTEF